LCKLLEENVRPERIIATTFTQKAAAELQERVRIRLLEAGRTEAANALGSAMIGTVHSIGIRLLQRFAFEAGVSPLVEVIDEADEQRLFNESLAQVLSAQRIETMNTLAEKLGLTQKGFGEAYDWRRDIRSITDVARSNNFSRSVLEESKQRSWNTFQAYLPEPAPADSLTWNNRLVAHIDQCIAALEANASDTTKVTREAVETLRISQNQLSARGGLDWADWVRIGKLKVSAKSRDLAEPLTEFARSHDQHATFQSDIRSFQELVFDIAIDALEEYQQYKKKRGLIDYTDMEAYISRLLRKDVVRQAIEGELDLLLVDEFQDTSPMQLDIFLQLSRIAKRSIWVGDPKQSIYGFRGAEPALMQAIVEATGGVKPENVLNRSWRSRPDLVFASNAIFTKAFDTLPAEQVALDPVFSHDTEAETAHTMGIDLPPALQHWHFKNEADERKAPKAWFQQSVAEQIFVTLRRGWPVFDKKRKNTRPIQPGDIAVLCRSNKDCMDMAEALNQAGVKASIARSGLLETTEARLVTSCLKYLLNENDHLSAAEVLIISGASELEELIRNRVAWLHEQEQQGRSGTWAAHEPLLVQLNTLRTRVIDLSASEALNLLLDELDLGRISIGLGDANQRLQNLDALRKLSHEYEKACTRLHAAATLGGFLLWLNEKTEQGSDAQGSSQNMDAVNVLTYHKSKGLEFPLTVCMNIDQNLREKVWGVNLVSDAQPQIDDILANRWIRFWVNPYGQQARNTRLLEQLEQGQEWQDALEAALAEEARLLYVGLTRARDYLVFPTSIKPTLWLNRVFNEGQGDMPTLDPNQPETPFEWNGLWLNAQTEVIWSGATPGERGINEAPTPYPAAHTGRSTIQRLPHRIEHLIETPPLALQINQPFAFASWLPIKADLPDAAIHALRHCMSSIHTDSKELAVLQSQLYDLHEAFTSEDLIRQTEAFRSLVQQHAPGYSAIAQYPLEGWYGSRWLKMKVDLHLEGDQETISVFFAPFSEGMKKWEQTARPLISSAFWAAWMLGQAQPAKRHKAWIVFPFEGQVCICS
jgi:ATP-dependent helicase/nuclease subunit A